MTAHGRALRERWNGIKGMEIKGNLKRYRESRIYEQKEPQMELYEELQNHRITE